jgi:hypothetical protein
MQRLLLILFLTASLSHGAVHAQTPAALPSLSGIWEGSIMIGRESFNIAFSISMEDGKYSATLISRQMGVYGMPADLIEVLNDRVRIVIITVDGEFTGRVRSDENGIIRISGDWFQEGEMLPLTLLWVEKPTL